MHSKSKSRHYHYQMIRDVVISWKDKDGGRYYYYSCFLHCTNFEKGNFHSRFNDDSSSSVLEAGYGYGYDYDDYDSDSVDNFSNLIVGTWSVETWGNDCYCC